MSKAMKLKVKEYLVSADHPLPAPHAVEPAVAARLRARGLSPAGVMPRVQGLIYYISLHLKREHLGNLGGGITRGWYTTA